MNSFINIARYQIRESKTPLLFFYGIITGLAILILTTSGGTPTTITEVNGVTVNVGYSSSNSNLSGASIIFIFIVGLNSFKNTYKFMQANNVSRKSFYIGNLVSIASIVAFMAVIDSIVNMIMSRIAPYSSTLEQIYNKNNFFIDLTWTFTILAFAFTVGWLITLIYYRSNSLMKVVVSVLPVPLFIGLAYINRLTSGKVGEAIAKFFDNALGITSVNPYMGMVSFTLGAALIYGLSYLLLRRAPIKI